jgi:threonine dehydrogenase-like Zn-dependent dehydrogenase
MKAIVYHGKEDMRVESVPDPGLQSSTDVLLRVERTAICGSDLHLWHLDSPLGTDGFVVGHEFLGTVEDVGHGVATIAKGDRVLVSCTIGCGRCASCRRGVYSGCSTASQGGTVTNVFGFSPVYNGGQAEAVRVPFADVNCFKVPEALSDDQCLFLTDILPTGFMGTELAEVGAGDRVVVFGCGPVGTFAQRCAQVRGAAQVIAVDPDAGRLARAAARGCEPIDPSREDVVARVLELTGGAGVDAAIEAVGRAELVAQAAMVTRAGGRVAVIGVILAPIEVPWPIFFNKNLSVRTGLVNPQVYIPHLLPLIESGRLDPTEIISHRLPLADGRRAYEMFAAHRDNVLKVVLTP